MKALSRERLSRYGLPVLVLMLAIGLLAAGLLLLSRQAPRAARLVARWDPDDIAPALALRTLAGDADAFVLDQALEEDKLETAFVTLYFSTGLSDRERANYYIALGERYAQARQNDRARFCYGQAASILLLSADITDTAKASAHLTLGKNLATAGDRAEAERNLDFAYTTARYSPYIEESQRRFILSNLTPEYKALNLDRKSDETTKALATLTAGIPSGPSPANVDLPAPTIADDVRAATAWRQRAAQRLINSMGSKNKAAISEAQRNLADALRAEDDLRSLMLENRMGQAPSLEMRAALARSRSDWLVLRMRIAQRGFGLSLTPEWEKDLTAIKNNLRQAQANYHLLRREMAVALPDPVASAQARVDLLRHEMMAGKVGLYPDYPENRLISELAQATKERIDLREDGLYVAVLSQEGRGLLVITTADLWGRPAAMASAGLGMSFPTIRPPALAFVPSPTVPPSPTVAPTRPPVALRTPSPTLRPQSPDATPVSTPEPGATPLTPMPPLLPTQPASPPATRPPVAIASPTAASTPTPLPVVPTQPPPPTPAPPPTPTFTPPPTPTPAYNYQVIYRGGPTVRQETGYDNLHIVGMVVDQNGILIPGVLQRISWCCPPGEAVHPRPGIDADNGRFDFFVSRGQFTLDLLDGAATTEPIVINTDVPGLTGYIEWEYTLQRTSRAAGASGTRTPTATPTVTPTGTPPPPSPTPPLPGAVEAAITLDPGWNFIGLPLLPVSTYSATSLQAEMNNQIYNQGGGVSQISYWDGSRIAPFSANITMGVGYFVNITGTNRVTWRMVGYPLNAAVPLTLAPNQKVSIAFPYLPSTLRRASTVRTEINALSGDGAFVKLWKMIDTQGNWRSYPDQIGDFDLQSNTGYLIEVSRQLTWTPGQTMAPTATSTPTMTPSVTPTASPTPFDTYEPNDSFDQAQLVTPNTVITSYITSAQDRDYFKFTVPSPTTIQLSLTDLLNDYDLYLYNPSRSEIDASINGGANSEYITKTVTLPGTYYMLVNSATGEYNTSKRYKLTLSFGQ